ncbi:MAG: hypothetical protein Q9P44_01965 [Anaerolineae bacterium]|nr:hypothetical protein [Anaerolineae bacterium]
MNKIAVVVVVILLLGSLALTSYAAYNGAGLVTSGSGNPSSRSSLWFPVFIGGGPGSGK